MIFNHQQVVNIGFKAKFCLLFLFWENHLYSIVASYVIGFVDILLCSVIIESEINFLI